MLNSINICNVIAYSSVTQTWICLTVISPKFSIRECFNYYYYFLKKEKHSIGHWKQIRRCMHFICLTSRASGSVCCNGFCFPCCTDHPETNAAALWYNNTAQHWKKRKKVFSTYAKPTSQDLLGIPCPYRIILQKCFEVYLHKGSNVQ